MSCPSWVLGTGLGSSARAAQALTAESSLQPTPLFLKTEVLGIECMSVCLHGKHFTDWTNPSLLFSDRGFYYVALAGLELASILLSLPSEH